MACVSIGDTGERRHAQSENDTQSLSPMTGWWLPATWEMISYRAGDISPWNWLQSTSRLNQSRFDYQENSCQRPSSSQLYPVIRCMSMSVHMTFSHYININKQRNINFTQFFMIIEDNMCVNFDRLWLWFRITAQDIGECLYFLWVFV